MRNKTLLIGVIGIVLGVLLSTAVVLAGSLNPSVGPGDAASQMYTLEQIYQRLTTGNYFAKQSGFTEPGSGPGTPTMHTLDEIMARRSRGRWRSAWPRRDRLSAGTPAAA